MSVDRSTYQTRIERGRHILGESDDPDWPVRETGNVLAALSLEHNATDISTRMLDMDGTVACRFCDATYKLVDALDAMLQ